jgi:TetR/AcrR family transcriptional regulator, transcriptional repressor for nem operon
MARPREFDRSKTVEKAMRLFWKQGYEATSVQELVDCLGLKPGSLYNAFGDKHSLYLEALDCYQDREREQMCMLLDAPESPRAALRELFLAVVATDVDDPDHKGCMLVNAAAELAVQDAEVRERMAVSRAWMETRFQAVLARAQELGEVDPAKDPAALAAFLVNSLFGLRVTAKVLNDRAALMRIVDVTLGALG